MNGLLLASRVFAAEPSAHSLSVLSQNLHGYHPMGEAPRLLQKRSGAIEEADSAIFFFTPEELERGHRRRLDSLSRAVRALAPDVVLLQEVGAGSAAAAKSCETFYANRSGDGFELNSALRLQRRVQAQGVRYVAALACRGNTGWWTEPGTFHEMRVLRQGPHGPELVFDFDSNPYPSGVIVEGMAVLVKDSWRVTDSQQWRLETGGGRSFFVQAVAISPAAARAVEGGGAPWVLVVNVHAGHKVEHFEQAVALRRKILEYTRSRWRVGRFLGTVVGGDFNALLFRRDEQRDPSTVPWEVAVEGEFDYSRASARAELVSRLQAMNRDPQYKPWAGIADPGEASARIGGAVASYFELLLEARAPGFRESIEAADPLGRCAPFGVADSVCARRYGRGRIDFLFGEPDWEIEAGFVPFASNNWKSLHGISDHPGAFARWKVQRSR